MDGIALIAALALVGLNGFFVATEFAVVKVRPTRIEALIRANRPGARAVRRIIGNVDHYLSATQLGITFASLGLGWLGKPAFAHLLAPPLAWLGVHDPDWRSTIAGGVSFAVISFLHIVLGELAPKSLAILHAESVAMAVAWPMRLFYTVFFPITWALNGMAYGALRIFGIRPNEKSNESHSEEEIRIILAQARSAGLLGGARADVLRRALTLSAKTARHLMVPRNEVVFLDTNLSFEENIERAMRAGHTRFPLCDRELDEVIGIVDIRDVLFQQRSDDLHLETFVQPAAFIPEVMSGERLLADLRHRRITMGVVVDEYGGASGILTPADLVSAVMGEIDDDDDADVVALPGGAYDVDGVTPLEELEEVLKLEVRDSDMRTVAGFLMERLGRMPRSGDRVVVQGYIFCVAEMEGPKVVRVRINREGVVAARRGAAPNAVPSAPAAGPERAEGKPTVVASGESSDTDAS